MRFVRRNQALLLFVAVLVLCSVKVIGQFQANESRHVENRESFLVLYAKGYFDKADHFYERLVFELPDLPDKTVLDDYQRVTLITPANQKASADDLFLRYRAQLKNEIEKRSPQLLARALKIADDK